MISLRCSSLPLVTQCAAAAVPPRERIESPRDASDLGSAFHDAIAQHIIGDDPVDLGDIAAAHNVERDDLAPMFFWARRVWDDTLAAMFPEPVVEEFGELREEDGFRLTGTPDVVSFVGDELRGLDWKSGWVDADATDQLRGYALLYVLVQDEIKTVRFTKLRIREQRAETYVWTRSELLAWYDWLHAHTNGEGRDIYRPGEHCARCPRRLECTARTAALRQAIELLPQDGRLARMSDDSLANIVLQARALEKVLEGILSAAKVEVQTRGGVAGPLKIVEQERRSIDLPRAWDILRDAVGEGAILDAAKVSKSEIEKVVRAAAPRGQKEPAVKDLMQKLEAANALTVTTIMKLEIDRGYADASKQLPAAANATAGAAAE